jgi:hypothetical protein
MQITEKQEQINNLDELCEQYDINSFREKIIDCMAACVKNVKKEEVVKSQQIMDEAEQYLLKQMQDHDKNTQNMNKEDVFIMSLQIYKSHLRDLIN